MKLYFAYGANLNKHNMAYRCPDAVPVESFYLPGYQLVFSGVATIVPDPAGCVAGALWAISDADEKSLDAFEGYPALYRKETIKFDDLEFMVYVMNSSWPSEPSLNYVMTIAEGYQDWALDVTYLSDAIDITQKEIYDNDLQRSTSTGTAGYAGSMASDLYLESGNDVRWLRDIWRADRYPSTME